uniref:Uncharacterized protein n=1 Tax=Percolomonas cosmopolitus TaxID=63605 RepID=A0A7S1PGZ5_9EUKA|mmetsp:Transcript_110/g.406  ORF Transcript_110/g.406 Transcript_110/m.406 type:complete len:168 (+) Transcript_110:95-598(+)
MTNPAQFQTLFNANTALLRQARLSQSSPTLHGVPSSPSHLELRASSFSPKARSRSATGGASMSPHVKAGSPRSTSPAPRSPRQHADRTNYNESAISSHLNPSSPLNLYVANSASVRRINDLNAQRMAARKRKMAKHKTEYKEPIVFLPPSDGLTQKNTSHQKAHPEA